MFKGAHMVLATPEGMLGMLEALSGAVQCFCGLHSVTATCVLTEATDEKPINTLEITLEGGEPTVILAIVIGIHRLTQGCAEIQYGIEKGAM